jgi:hypothetical protein
MHLSSFFGRQASNFFKCICREKCKISFYGNKPVTYYTTFGKEENQKLHCFFGWSGLYFLRKQANQALNCVSANDT